MKHANAPLSQSEIANAVTVTRNEGGLDETTWFETISLDESGRYPEQRSAYVCCYEASSNRTFTGVVLLEQESLQNWQHVEDVQPRITPDEFTMACELAREDENFLAALKKRGIEDASQVLIESWSSCKVGAKEEA